MSALNFMGICHSEVSSLKDNELCFSTMSGQQRCGIRFIKRGHTSEIADDKAITVDEENGSITIKAERSKTKANADWFKGLDNTVYNIFDGKQLTSNNMFGSNKGVQDQDSNNPGELNFAVYGDLSFQFPYTATGETWYNIGAVTIGQGSFPAAFGASNNDWWIGSPLYDGATGKIRTDVEGKYVTFFTCEFYEISVELVD